MSVKLVRMGKPTKKGTNVNTKNVLTYELSSSGRVNGTATTVTVDIDVELSPHYAEPNERCKATMTVDFAKGQTTEEALTDLHRILKRIVKGFAPTDMRDDRCGDTVPLSFSIPEPKPEDPPECCCLVSPKDDRDFCERPMGHEGRHYTSALHGGTRHWFEDDGEIQYERDDSYVLDDWIDPARLSEQQRVARIPWAERDGEE